MTQSSEQNVIWLTQEAFSKLQAELDNLRGPVRSEVIARISAAREEGDLKENGGYHAAKDEQGKLEARIRVLTELLRDAQVGEAPVVTDRAAAGTLVEVQFEGDDATETFLLGSREDRVEGYQIYSPSSPLGHAVLGHQAGEMVSYLAPRGATMKVSIVSVQPYHG